MKTASDMTEGRLDMLKSQILTEMAEDDEASGAGTFGIFTGGGSGGGSGAGSSGGVVASSERARRTNTKARPASADPRVVGARLRKDTVKLFTSVQVQLEKAIQAGNDMISSMQESHGENAKDIQEFKTLERRLQCLNLLKDARRGHNGGPGGDIGEQVVKLMKEDPYFGEQKIEADRVQTIGYMHFCRNTLLEMCRTAEHCSELGEKHKDSRRGR